jgi:UMF1 family MFS transporter
MPVAPENRREIFGWQMYDWANSAFQTTVVTVLIGPYLTSLAQQAVGDNGVVMALGPFGAVTAKSFYPYCIALSVFLQIFLLPLLGGAADASRLKKPLMMAFCYVGVIATCLLFFIHTGNYLAGGALLIVANLCFGASLVLYNAFLNDIAPAHLRDDVSSRGYALGYLGGGVLLAANLALIVSAGSIGMTKALAVRLSLLSAGLWWGGFAAVTFTRLRTHAPAGPGRPDVSAAGPALTEWRRAGSALLGLPHTLRYLAGYMLFNDGIQTVISIASVFLAQELFVAK